LTVYLQVIVEFHCQLSKYIKRNEIMQLGR